MPHHLRPFSWDWSLILSQGLLGSSDWRSWISDRSTPPPKGKLRRIPGATVEVVDRVIDLRRDQVLELNASIAPVLVSSFLMGERSSVTSQMLTEFMSMHGSNFHPPTLPSVWYNGLIPYWVQQGWSSASGVTVRTNSEVRPVMLYPGRR